MANGSSWDEEFTEKDLSGKARFRLRLSSLLWGLLGFVFPLISLLVYFFGRHMKFKIRMSLALGASLGMAVRGLAYVFSRFL